MRTSLTRALAAAAITTAAVVAVAGAANASTSAPFKETTLSIVAAKTVITVGQVDTVSGVLKSHRTPLAHRIVVLDRFWARAWRPVEEKYTGKFGGVSFVVKPQVSTAYKLIFRGGDMYDPTHSGAVVVRVKKPIVKVATALSIWESMSSIVKGSTDHISGGLSADSKSLPGRWVWLATVSNGTVHPLRARLTGTTGIVTFTVAPDMTTTYELVYRGTETLVGTTSGTATTTVTLPAASA